MKFPFVLYFLFFFSVVVTAQQQPEEPPMRRVQIIQADFLRTLRIDSMTIDRLLGDVVIEHNNVIMFCDSAYRFPNDRFEAYGNVRVVNKGTTVTGDKMIYDGIESTAQVRGDIVYLKDSTATLRTTAVDYNTKEEIGFFENEGTIHDSTRLLESKQGYYYSKLKDFIFIGSVQSKTDTYTLQSDSMQYNTETKLFTFYSSTSIWADSSYLFCNRGWYDSDNERMFFLKDSYLQTAKQEVWADSMYYESKTGQGRLYQNIQLLDTAQKSIAFGDFADFNTKREEFELTLDPSILFYPKEDAEEKDTLYLRADKLRSIIIPIIDSTQIDSPTVTDSLMTGQLAQMPTDSLLPEVQLTDTVSFLTPPPIPTLTDTVKKDSTYREVFGLKNVKIFRNDFQAVCDSLYMNTLDSVWRMYHDPIIWNGEKMQLSADTVKFFSVDGKLNRAEFQTNSMIVIPENDSSEFYNQIKGKDMTGYFENNELSRFNVFSQVQSLFFSSEELAVDFKESGSMAVQFENKKIRRVTYIGEVTGKLSPLMLVPVEEHKLKGFGWHDDRHPKSKEDILKRTIVPTRREEVEAIEFPTFPITKRIDELSQKLLLEKPKIVLE